MILELDAQQAHIGVIVSCSHTFDHIVYIEKEFAQNKPYN